MPPVNLFITSLNIFWNSLMQILCLSFYTNITICEICQLSFCLILVNVGNIYLIGSLMTLTSRLEVQIFLR